MKPHLECVPCLMRQAQEAIALTALDTESAADTLRSVLRLVARADWNLPVPVLAQQVHRLVRQLTDNADPYASVKTRLNQRAACLYPTWHRRFQENHPPLEAAIRMAIVGNLLDVGAKTQLDDDGMVRAFEDALTAPLRGSVAEFAAAIRGARSILYLADNAGEIVFDRDLLAQLPLGHFTLVVRGSPVLNDATLADARETGLVHVCEIMANGSDAPGTLLEDCSPEFRARFEAADLVIAKGQGNYESLAEADKHIAFLLKVKCPVLAESLHCPCGSLVLHHQHPVESISPTPSM
jgi:uncharacterized protein with ATP-grasp and redox domains